MVEADLLFISILVGFINAVVNGLKFSVVDASVIEKVQNSVSRIGVDWIPQDWLIVATPLSNSM